ncbi:MAG: SIMPL domain-containing protein [Defluviitaleaceae bacterium]|nr:SIMPL domain-containing protein [Defluviitaleaceae bacterium]
MKRFAACFTLALVMAFVAVIAAPVSVYAQSEQPVIRVSGAASVTAEPDFANVVLGVETTANNPQEAISQNNAIVERTLAAIRALGIDDDDIVTQHFSLRQAFDFSMGWSGTPIGYTVFNTVSVTIHDLDNLGAVISAGIGAGANISGGIHFGVQNPSPLYYEALQLAVEDARNKANAMAAALNLTITGVASATETSSWGAPVFRTAQAPGAVAEAAMMMDMAMMGGGAVPILTGEIVITARVEIAYFVR